MWTFYVGVFAIWTRIAEAEYNILASDGGWVPVSSETVYNQIKHGHNQWPHYIATQHIQVINTDINKILPQKGLRVQEDNTVKTEVNSTDDDCTAEDLCENCKVNNLPILKVEEYFVPNVYKLPRKENYTVSKTARSARKISDFNDVRQLFLSEHKNTNKNMKNRKVNTYEVTEKANLEDLTEQEESETKNIGYKYEPPKKQTETNGLFEILSKYKINKDDDLPNYALSRRAKVQVPFKQIASLKPFQNQAPYQYNNLNHLSVDPILAVLLSNYGFYLQGMYGIRNNYNNLYGYLASNNIHNNKPFGFYKVFSDTDSSH